MEESLGSIKGYTFNEVLLCFSTIFMAFALAECFGRGFDTFSGMIGNGEFDRIMVRPQNEILQIIGSRIELTRIGRLIQALVIFIYSINSCGVVWSFDKIITLILMLIGGFCLFFALFMIYATICFFTFFVPLAFINYYPFLYIIGKSKGILNMVSPTIAVLFLVPSYIFWRFGVRHYKSTGS